MLNILKSRWTRVILLALIVAAGLFGCRQTHEARGPTGVVTAPPPPSTTHPPPHPRPSPEAQAAEAYVRASGAYVDALLAPNPNDPRLPQLISGRALLETQRTLSDMVAKRISLRLRSGRRPQVNVTMTRLEHPDRVTLIGCERDDSVQVQLPGPHVVNDVVTSRLSKAEIHLEPSGWKVIDNHLMKEWRDGRGCAR